MAAYRILAACDVTQAYGMLERQQTIQIVIIDLDMPDSRGMQLLAMVKSEPRFSSTHVIILTRSDDPDQEISGLRLGADDYLRKPILKETLRARIDMHFELAKQKVLEQQLKDQGQLFNAIFQQAPIGITISHDSEPRSDGSDDLFDVNPLFERITGRSKDELISLGWLNITHPDDRARDLQYYMQLQEGQIPSYEMEKRYLRPDGSSVWVQMIVAPLKVSGTKSFNHICLVQDISKRKEIEQTLAESERSKSVLLAHLPGMAYRCNYDHDWTMQFVSEGCHELTGYASDELLQNRSISYNELIAPEYRDYLWQKWELTLSHREQFRSEYEIFTARG
ncbi:MAG: PAS domain S-box protein, partial [Sphaerochaetaceae bacterium]|nr:PAS domain S-box protein [Sphaerochaetaceae bacterium]